MKKLFKQYIVIFFIIVIIMLYGISFFHTAVVSNEKIATEIAQILLNEKYRDELDEFFKDPAYRLNARLKYGCWIITLDHFYYSKYHYKEGEIHFSEIAVKVVINAKTGRVYSVKMNLAKEWNFLDDWQCKLMFDEDTSEWGYQTVE